MQNCTAQTFHKKGVRRLAKCFGLRIMSTVRTFGVVNSFHLKKNAFNRWGNARTADVVSGAGVYLLARYAKRHPKEFVEFMFDPLGWFIDNGRIIKGWIGGHYDHAHIVLRK